MAENPQKVPNMKWYVLFQLKLCKSLHGDHYTTLQYISDCWGLSFESPLSMRPLYLLSGKKYVIRGSGRGPPYISLILVGKVHEELNMAKTRAMKRSSLK